MKRLLLFVALLCTGFALLALLLGDDELFRDFAQSRIAAENLGELQTPIPYRQGSDEVIVSMPRSWEGAITETVSIQLPQIEAFDQGIVSARPVLTFFDEGHVLRARVTANRATIHAPHLHFEEFSRNRLRVQSIDLEGDVVGTWMDGDAEPSVVLRTSRAHLPGELLRDEDVRSPPISFPDALVVERFDGSLELRGRSGSLDLTGRTLHLAPPLRLYVREARWAATPGERATAPLEVTAAGPLRYDWEEAPRESGGQELAAQALQGGTLVVTRDVRVRQEDRWVRTEKLVLELARQPPPEGDPSSPPSLSVVRWSAGDGVAPVTCGLFGGVGTASFASYQADPEQLDFHGPVVFQDLVIADAGGEAVHLELLKALQQATLSRRASGQVELLLQGDAVLRTSDADAAARRLQALLGSTVRDPENRDATGSGGRLALERLELEGLGRLVFGGDAKPGARGTATGEHLVVEQSDRGGHSLDITGRASLTLHGSPGDRFERAEISGPALHATIPGSATEPFDLTVPELTGATLLLPADTSFLAAERQGDAPLLLVVTPERDASLVGSNTRFEFDRRCRYELSRENVLLQTLDADHLVLEEDGTGETSTARASGNVVCQDEAREVELTGEWVVLGAILVSRGQPARVSVVQDGETLALFGAEIRYDTHTGTLRAKAGHGMLASLEAPERFLREVLPEHAGGAATGGIVTLDAEELVLIGDGESAGAPGKAAAAFASLQARGRVHAVRASDGMELSGDELTLDREDRSATLVAAAGQLAELVRPLPGVPGPADRLRARSMKFRNGGLEADLAPGSELVFYLRRDGPDPAATPGRRVSLQVGNEVHLRGTEILCTGGVETRVQLRGGELHARSDRVVLVLDRPAVERGRPRQILAQQNVVLTHEDFRCSGALLAFDFETNWLELKAGAEPCRILSSSTLLPLPVDSRFHRLQSRIADDRNAFPVSDLRLERFELIAGALEAAAQ